MMQAVDQYSRPVLEAKAISSKFSSQLGFVNLAALQKAFESQELEVIPDVGFCNFHHRRDGQTTIYEIATTRHGEGWGRLLFYRVLCSAIERGCNIIVAKCPVDLPSNGFYERLGFELSAIEQGRKRQLNRWVYKIQLPLLFYCGGGGKSKYDEIAKAEGWILGIRSAHKNVSHEHMGMVDNLYENYDHDRHIAEVKKSKPMICTAMDIMTKEQCAISGVKYQPYHQILEQARELSKYCGRVLLIPKYKVLLPTDFNYWLAYSVPTSYGGTEIEPEWFNATGKPVHLLGGSPNAQARFYGSMNVVSLDANYSMKLAQRFGKSCWQGNSGKPMAQGTYESLRISLSKQRQYWREHITNYTQLSIL